MGTPYSSLTSFTMNGGKLISSDDAVRVASSSSDKYKDIAATFEMNRGEIEAAYSCLYNRAMALMMC